MCAKKVFVIPSLRSNKDSFKMFVKKTRLVKTLKQQNYLAAEFKIILYLNFLLQLPYRPDQLFQNSGEYNRFLNYLTLFNHITKTLLTIPLIIYARFLFVYTSLMVTFSVFLLFCLAISWSLFRKRQCVLRAMKMMIVISSIVNPRNFKSKWNIYLMLLFNAVAFLVFSIRCGWSAVFITYRQMNTTSAYFFWYEVTGKHERTFSAVLVFCAVFILTANSFAGSLVVLLSSTLNIHLSEIIFNFGMKLQKSLEYKQVSQYSLSQSLCVFQKIVNLNEAVNDALSLSVSFTYGAILALFFTGLCAIRQFPFELTEQILFNTPLFIYSLFSFFSMTFTGNKVQRNHEKCKDSLLNSLILILNRCENGKEIERFSLMAAEIKSHDLHLTGGNMFVLNNSLILSVAGALITYGVLLFQMG